MDVESSDPTLTDADRRTLLKIAERVIRRGVEQKATSGEPPAIPEEWYESLPPIERATFVTLEVDGRLNGCIGQLKATRFVGEDVRYNAYRAAFDDRRFDPLTPEQLPEADLHISVLDPLEEIPVDRPDDLWEFVEPGRHGLLLRTRRHRGTFLPSVWEKCPDPQTFLEHLRRKAGLSPGAWPDDLQVYRYTVDEFDRASLESPNPA
jgi:hypothetical protein